MALIKYKLSVFSCDSLELEQRMQKSDVELSKNEGQECPVNLMADRYTGVGKLRRSHSK